MPWKRILSYITGSVYEDQLRRIEDLFEENRAGCKTRTSQDHQYFHYLLRGSHEFPARLTGGGVAHNAFNNSPKLAAA
jgi:hypothetical protein